MLHKLPAMKINRRGSGKSGRIIPGKPRQVNSLFKGVLNFRPTIAAMAFGKTIAGIIGGPG